jgi:WD40 repeat protein
MAFNQGSTDDITTLAWKPDGTRLAAAYDTLIKIFDGSTYAPVMTFSEQHGEPIFALAWRPLPLADQLLSAGNGDQTMRRWNAATGERIALYAPGSEVRAAAWNPNGSEFVFMTDSGSLQIWDASTNTLVRQLTLYTVPMWIGWNEHDVLAISGYDGDCVCLLNALHPDLDDMILLRGITGPGEAGAWSPDGTQLAAGQSISMLDDGTDYNIHVWGVNSGVLITTLAGHTNAVMRLSWSPDGTRLASGSLDGTVRIWNTATWQPIQVIDAANSVFTVAWSPDGTKLAYGGQHSGANGPSIAVMPY